MEGPSSRGALLPVFDNSLTHPVGLHARHIAVPVRACASIVSNVTAPGVRRFLPAGAHSLTLMTNSLTHGAGFGSAANHGTDNGYPGVTEYTHSGVLHFLQSEWRRYEHERNAWAIERAELRVCIYHLI